MNKLCIHFVSLVCFVVATALHAQTSIPWEDIDTTGSSLADIDTREFSALQNKPTTLSGYGITDAATSAQGAKADTALQSAAIGVTIQAYDADLADLADGSLTGSKVGTGINADNITTGTVVDARIATTIARDSEVTSAVSALSSVYQPLDTDLTAWAAVNPSSYSTTAQVAAAYQPLDADLTDLADGTLTGSKVGTGINADNITSGTLADGRLSSNVPLRNASNNSFAGGASFTTSTATVLTVTTDPGDGRVIQALIDTTQTEGHYKMQYTGEGFTTTPDSFDMGLYSINDNNESYAYFLDFGAGGTASDIGVRLKGGGARIDLHAPSGGSGTRTIYFPNANGTLIVSTTVPSTASSTGTAGQIAYDSGYIYVCVATDTWKRAALSTW